MELLGCGAGAQFSLVDLKSEAKFLTVIIKSTAFRLLPNIKLF